MSKFNPAALWAVALVALAAPAAHAAVDASASLSNLQWTLTDLNPSDGVAPTLTFLDLDSDVSVSGQGWVLITGVSEQQAGQTAAVANDLYGTIYSASASLTSLTASGGTLGGIQPADISTCGTSAECVANWDRWQMAIRMGGEFSSWGANAYLNPEDLPNFVLSPQTSVTFSATASALKWPGPPSSSGVTLAVTDGVQSSQDSLQAAGDRTAPETLSVTMSNATDGSVQGVLTASAGAGGVSHALLPVPEPETYALMVTGLAMVAALARRQKRTRNGG